MADLNLDDEINFEQEDADARRKKAWLNAGSGVANALLNTRGASEILLGQAKPNNDFGASFRAAADNVRDPAETRKKAHEYLKMKREAAQMKDADSPTSGDAVAFRDFMYEVVPSMKGKLDKATLAQMERGSPLLMARFKAQQDEKLAKMEAGAKATETKNKTDKEAKEAELNLTNLPLEEREVVKALAQRNATALAIANDIDVAIKSWAGMDDNQKLANMQGLIKGLNSKYGNDAVGQEEVKRLSPKLNFAFGNFTNDNPTQFGRDLKGFETDAANSSKNLRSLVQENENEIARRKGQAPRTTEPPPEDEYVEMISPKGLRKRVKKSDVPKALAQGGQLVTGPAVGAK